MIKISGLEKVYKNNNADITALEELNPEVGTGDIFGIIGLIGGGRSALARCINLLERPTSGIRETYNRVAVIDNNPIVETGPVIDVIAHAESESARKLGTSTRR